ncbi:GMP synthase [glutamine-hydrolyzing] subunit A [Striga asiatica]|uniref:GMP synthase [glutamine-hydrolyzing] subunit A n=1 Tax=Striga asiatica TaxID=4170 RepID=A0A5A7PW95_STRAF|nr:GMP synthase [glutamine-hydrolyzing] subunit A [Striga asiatica]
MVGPKFAILMCAEDSDYIKQTHGGYYGVYLRMLKEDGETWDMYHVAGGTFPADDVLGDYDGFVITGSCNDAHSDDTWILTLLSLLHKLLALEKKILGICFERSKTGWDIGITKVNMKNSRFPACLEIPSSLSIIECHQDEVREIPPKAEVLAWSDKTGVEMLVYGEHESLGKEVKSKLGEFEADTQAWKKLCVSFLKGRLS